ncbi:hypothetical protein EHS25_003974 [Saitozyma podzolica]|uniref:NmrA-like domain-containing protein n=1 Tax=Saitozyma podzolica TaxID=1890683 RepID=A0A427YT28_9TREE|nr:hypothetical protein EHS25_003974 [Saitozyma podzolica]
MDEPAKASADAGLKKGDVQAVLSVQSYVSPKVEIAQGGGGYGLVELRGSYTRRATSEVYRIPDWTWYESKRTVENHIRTLPMTWTFLRPVQFMEKWLPDASSTLKFARTMLLKYGFRNHPERKHQLISAREVHQEAMGKPVETSLLILVWFARRYVLIARKVMNFFDDIGYNVDIPKLREEFPGLQDCWARLELFRA